MPFQPQCNWQQDSTFKDIHYIKYKWPRKWRWLHLYKEADHNQDWGEEFVVELLHIIEIVQQIVVENLLTNMFKNDQHYYVNML
jgi:hypothetical protein